MPSDSVVGFLDRAQANRVLFPEQVEQLIRQPDIPQSDVNSFCEYLLTRGVLTRFQATAIRDARGQELTFAGYPVIDELGPCPGGTAYKALHPSLRTPLVLRRIRAEWLVPDDTVENYLQRARSIGMLTHANIVPLLDAGFYKDELYLVIDVPAEAANVEVVAGEVGGAMPGFLAAEYGRVVASALRMAHERGGVHGEVRPGNLLVGPLTTKKGPDGKERRRPAPNASVRLMELGLIPQRPPATQFTPERAAALYLPPERLDSGVQTPRGDVYGLGAILYFLLAGRAAFDGRDVAEILRHVRAQEPTSLAALRPDLPREFVGLVARMIDRNPQQRPANMAAVESELSAFCRPATVAKSAPVASSNTADGAAAPIEVVAIPVSEEAAAPGAFDDWGTGSPALVAAHADAPKAPRVRGMTTEEKRGSMMLLILGGLLHITWITLLIVWIAGGFSSKPEPEPTTPTPTKKEPPSKKKKAT